MNIIELLHNTALLVALAAIYQVLLSRFLPHSLVSQGIMGLLFGLTTMLGMMDPVVLAPGIIFDGRSIILTVAGLVGGPLVAAISAVIAGGYRLYVGGPGAPVGVSVVVAAAVIGSLFHHLRRLHGGHYNMLQLYGVGLLVHVLVLALFTQLPGDSGEQVIKALGPTIIIFYPLAVMLITLLFQDYEEREQAKGELLHLAYHDALSGLPNRTALLRDIKQALDTEKSGTAISTLVLLNIDRFKRFNDARGHTIGDALLRAVGQRLAPLLGHSGRLYRLSADEFAILQHNIDSESQLSDLTQAIHIAFQRPLHAGADQFTITVSIGTTRLAMHAADRPSDVMRRANTALHHAMRAGGNQTTDFVAEMANMVERQFQMERELHSAIGANQLQLYLQPQVDAAGAVLGAEVLVRWLHPQRGLVPPASFIPLAEESDLIIAVESWVINATCELLRHPELVNNDLHLSVNISPRHFRQPGFARWLQHTLDAHEVDPRRLTVEITEGVLIENIDDVAAKMEHLAGLGIRISVDDFGTGYSSLAYLKRLPIHELKIDRSFIQTAPQDPTIVEAILAVAERMELDVVAEGVETQEHLTVLRAAPRVIYQGYLFGRPEPADDWLARQLRTSSH